MYAMYMRRDGLRHTWSIRCKYGIGEQEWKKSNARTLYQEKVNRGTVYHKNFRKVNKKKDW